MATEAGAIYVKITVQMADFERQMNRAEQKVRQFDGRQIRLNVQGAVRGLQSLSDAFKAPTDAYNNLVEGLGRMGDKLTSWGMDLASFGYRMMLATAPLGAAGFASLKMMQDLDTSMAMVGTQLKLRGPELEEFTDRVTKAIVDLSTEIPLATNDIADALYYLVSSLTIDPELATTFLEPISRLAVAGHATAEEVARAITPILNVYKELGRTAEDIEHVGDVIFAAVQRGTAEFGDMIVQIGDFIQFAKTAGATFEEAMAVFAMATRVTTPAQAATWVKNVYRALFTPKTVELLQEHGIAVTEIVEGTGEWVTKTKEQTEAEADLIARLKETIRTKREQIGFAGARLGIGEEIWQRVQTYVETGELLPGVTRSLADAYRDMGAAQDELNVLLAAGAETYQAWTGELARRPSIELIEDIAKLLSTIRDPTEREEILYGFFPRMRGFAGALNIIENLQEIVEWEKEFVESTGLTQEAFEIMMATFESKIGLLKNLFLALGFELLAEYEDDIKNVIDALTDLFRAFRELPEDVKAKAAIISGLLLLAGPAALVGSVLLMGGGMLISLIASLASLPSLVMLTGLGVLLGDKLPLLLEAASAYGGGLAGVVTSIADLAVHFGILSKEDAIGILEDLGIQIDDFDDEKIDNVAKGIEDIAGAISRGVDDLVEWKDAFGLFLEDIEKREGAVGTLVRHLETLRDVLSDLYDRIAPILGLPAGVEEYKELGPPEKAGLIDKAAGFLIGSKLASWIFAGLAKALSAAGGAAMILHILGITGAGATTTATAAGLTIGAALAGGLKIALLAGLGVALFLAEQKIEAWAGEWDEYLKRRLPTFWTRPEDVEFEPPPDWTGPRQPPLEPGERVEEPEWIKTIREAFTEHLFPPIQEKWDEFYSRLTDYPETAEGEEAVCPLAENFLTSFTDRELEIEDAITGPVGRGKELALDDLEEIQEFLDNDIAKEREMPTEFRLTNEAELDEALKKMRELEGHHISIVDVYFRYHGEEGDHHLGGYAMHEGGYPSLNMPNLLASEFVLSPHTTHTLENYLGRLNQEKVRSVVSQPRVGMTVNFFKGSVTSKEDAEEAAEIIFDRLADRAIGVAHLET